MIWRLLSSIRRIVRSLSQPPDVSRAWLAQQRASEWSQGIDANWRYRRYRDG